MKMEYLDAGSADCPLIRLYDFGPVEAAQVLDTIRSLAEGKEKSIALNEALGLESVSVCRLNLRTGSRDKGIAKLDKDVFECVLTPESWDNVSGLVEPFGTGASGYQWLDKTGGIALLLSVDGHW